MKSTFLESFLLGVTVGIGVTVLSLYTRKPVRVAASIDAISEIGRARRAKEEEKKLYRERLQEMGFSNIEIDETLK
jgi:hypothetical protein